MVGDLAVGWLEAETTGKCDRERGDALVGVIQKFNAAQLRGLDLGPAD